MNDLKQLAHDIKTWGETLGFDRVGITDVDLGEHEAYLEKWLANRYHGEMDYMAKWGVKRSRPDVLVPGTMRIISVAMNYLPKDAGFVNTLKNPNRAFISRYALGRDYHKIIKKKLVTLAKQINERVDNLSYRAFVDSAPVLERAIAMKAGLGWIGKHSCLIHKEMSSWFFLGELYTNIPLPIDAPETKTHCGSCTACIDVCPTQAIVKPYVVDANRCISYLTIEYKGSIPRALRPLMGNRIYGCDDCQLVCPWNKFIAASNHPDFAPRHGLDRADLIALFQWTEADFMQKTEGQAIRRVGYVCWLRNIAIALGNAPYCPEIVAALKTRQDHESELVKEHVLWALARHQR
jgi:epoxyqueuosine reductase